ncbi:unnamed protein product [Pleuronectes platessa]|uniref:Uncharacterized protein n=1 Tax=Pleuronectes platessa TaxID=8262 RepID=A0A9N7VIR1_PLEPL|nr:unnamed protein product [Pleuronectes platessa]
MSCTFAQALASHWLNLQGASEEPTVSVYQPNNLDTSRASNPRGTNRSEDELSEWRDTNWGQVSFKAPEKLKGSGPGQQEQGDFTALPDGVFGLSRHRTEASLTAFPFQVSV